MDERRSAMAGRKEDLDRGADGEASSSAIHRHLVLAVEVGEADLGGVLERAVGLAPRPGTHARAPGAAVPRHGPRSPLTHRRTDLPACQPTRSPDPSLARHGRRGPHQGRRTGGAGSRHFGGKQSKQGGDARARPGRAGTPSTSPWPAPAAADNLIRKKKSFIHSERIRVTAYSPFPK